MAWTNTLLSILLIAVVHQLHGECLTSDPELDSLVTSAGTKSILYIIAHSNAYTKLANDLRSCRKDWIRAAEVPVSVYFESMMYRTILPSQHGLWSTYDYVITATYKTMNRTLLPRYMPVQSFDSIKTLLQHAKSGQYDVLPFMRDHEEMMNNTVKYHGQAFKDAWDGILIAMGFDEPQIRAFDAQKIFYRNVFIIRPHILQQLMQLMQRAIKFSLKRPELKELLSKRANYVLGKPDVAIRVFGTKYYQQYPFVFERLPAFFLYSMGAKICSGPDTPCKYNYKG